jgi:hypothetical protein
MTDIIEEGFEEVDEEESEWERQKRNKEEMNQRFDKLFSLFPDAIKFNLSCSTYYYFNYPSGTKHISVHYMDDKYNDIHVVHGYATIDHSKSYVDGVTFLDINKKDYRGDIVTNISDEDAKELLITAVKSVYKTDANERVSVERRGKSRIYSVDHKGNAVVEERENRGYSLTVPVVEIKHYNSNTFEWFEG